MASRVARSQPNGGERVVAADLTLCQLTERDYWPMLDGLADAGRRSRRGVGFYKNSWRLYIADTLGDVRLGQIDAATLSLTREQSQNARRGERRWKPLQIGHGRTWDRTRDLSRVKRALSR